MRKLKGGNIGLKTNYIKKKETKKLCKILVSGMWGVARGEKCECVKRITEKLGRERPAAIAQYNGDVSSIPQSVTDIAKMSSYSSRTILRFPNVLDCGTKD